MAGISRQALCLLFLCILTAGLTSFKVINRISEGPTNVALYGIRENRLPIYPRNHLHIMQKQNLIFTSGNQKLVRQLTEAIQHSGPLAYKNEWFSCKACLVFKKGNEITKIVSIGTNCTMKTDGSSFQYSRSIDSLLLRYTKKSKREIITEILPGKGYCDGDKR